MFGIVVWACLVGEVNQCRVYPVAGGFVSERACMSNVEIVPGWFKLHPQIELREGTRPMCVDVDRAAWLIGRFGA